MAGLVANLPLGAAALSAATQQNGQGTGMGGISVPWLTHSCFSPSSSFFYPGSLFLLSVVFPLSDRFDWPFFLILLLPSVQEWNGL